MSSFILSLHNILTLPLAVIGPTVLILLMLAASIAASVKQRSGVILSVCLSHPFVTLMRLCIASVHFGPSVRRLF